MEEKIYLGQKTDKRRILLGNEMKNSIELEQTAFTLTLCTIISCYDQSKQL